MGYRVEVSAQAKRDLSRIYLFIEAYESRTAAKWFNRLHEDLQSLANMPERAPLIREGQNLRHLLFGTKPHIYRVIFRIREDRGTVTILSIHHGARKPFKPSER
ncbi:mRNA-degrading endonuclease RelE, toxin component of the RelBE toxin-antitoxin system [Granulicella rosea]|uniref:mRNA-degrading endonuclease RelE, toxin component of the RelBE toxin-antitoxin system n=1 Tax=Granulicella rosea TaxID=474952 RepID=A0A239HTF2_9BACT|nr:type II toxin-antitoxin system RelE/ParE family toxin [Granulicella rosea]SNS84616.1 mRNA-degrading endonuclease RelE, toxin component of the RelBE toxin-antitoxin system [Granulicella rosea]